MAKQKCIECGKVLVANEYGVLYCPKCQKNFSKQFNAMVEDEGGYY